MRAWTALGIALLASCTPAEAEHRAETVEPGDSLFQWDAMTARFGTDHVVLEGMATGQSWTAGLRLTSIGRAETHRPLPPVRPVVDGERIEYRRDGSTEWYVHLSRGLEQGLTVHERLPGAGPLRVGVEILGLLPMQMGDRVSLVDGAAVARATLSELHAFDADGRPLRARFDVSRGQLEYLVWDAGASYPIVIDPIVAATEAILRPSDPAENAYFGSAVAIDADTAIVGRMNEAVGGLRQAGSAYVFVRTGTVWSQQAKLFSPEPMAQSWFGYSVDVDGDTAVISARIEDHSGRETAGSAYVFVRTGESWSHQATLRLPAPENDDGFGIAVAIDGDTIAVAARNDEQPGMTGSGSVSIFRRTGTTWTPEALLHDPETTIFGQRLALDGDTLVASAVHDSFMGSSLVPTVHVFVRTTSWDRQAVLHSSAIPPAATGVQSVGLHSNTVFVGVPDDDHSRTLPKAGSVIVFERSGTAWTETAFLRAAAPEAYQWFGRSVDLYGDTAVIGASRPTGPPGRAFIFSRMGGSWSQELVLHASDPTEHPFGTEVAIDADTVLVAAELEDYDGLEAAGSVYAFLVSVAEPCSDGTECPSGHCIDGVCCDTACGGGDPDDCQACSTSAGGISNGLCGPVIRGTVCRAAAGICDAEETCDGLELACPADGFADATVVCRDAAGSCDVAETCSGGGPDCPADGLAAPGADCDDGLACTTASSCVDGTCEPGAERSCDDGDPCTVDSCAEPLGCANTRIPDCSVGGADGGTGAADREGAGGCGCQVPRGTGPSGSFLLIALACIVAWRIRRGPA